MAGDHLPAITVLTAVHNEELYIKQAIESILVQSLQDFEFLIVNDASTDHTRGTIGLYESDSRIRVIDNASKLGQGRSLNLGLLEAKGSLIARLDGNDVAMPTRLERQQAEMDHRAELALVGSFYGLVDENNETCGGITDLPVGCISVADTALYRCPFCHSSVMYRRDVVLAVNAYRGGPAEDWDLWARLLENHPGDNIPASLVQCRVMSSGISASPKSRSRQRQQSREIVQNALERRRAGHGPAPTALAIARNRLMVAIEYFAEQAVKQGRAALGELFSGTLPMPYDLETVLRLIVERAVELENSGLSELDVALEFIDKFFDGLPPKVQDTVGRCRQRTKSWFYIALATTRPYSVAARRNLLWQGVARDPRWLRNRGVLRRMLTIK